MAQSIIDAGICGKITRVKAELVEGLKVKLEIDSDCPSIQRMADQLKEVNAIQEIDARFPNNLIRKAFVKNTSHAACPVPIGIVKAVEVAAGLALPRDIIIKVSKE